MRLKNSSEYKFIGFERSRTKNKKYDAVLKNRKTGKNKRVPFGDKRYEHYKDSTGLHLFSHLNHGDTKRRTRFRKRHHKNAKHKFSSAYFSYYFLW